MCLLPKRASENTLKKYRYGQTTLNKMSEIQRVLLKGHLHFEETLKKKKTDKQQNGQHSKSQNWIQRSHTFSSLERNVKRKHYYIRIFLYLPVIQSNEKAKSGHLTEFAFIRAFWFGKLEFEAVYLQCNNTRLYGKNNKKQCFSFCLGNLLLVAE